MVYYVNIQPLVIYTSLSKLHDATTKHIQTYSLHAVSSDVSKQIKSSEQNKSPLGASENSILNLFPF